MQRCRILVQALCRGWLASFADTTRNRIATSMSRSPQHRDGSWAFRGDAPAAERMVPCSDIYTFTVCYALVGVCTRTSENSHAPSGNGAFTTCSTWPQQESKPFIASEVAGGIDV